MAYRELLRPDELVACVWMRDAAPVARRHRVLPDACVDVVSAGGRLVVAGPATGPVLADIPAGTPTFGVRLRVGAAGAALEVPAGELLDASVPLEDLWGSDAARIADRVAAATASSGDGSPTPSATAPRRSSASCASSASSRSPDAPSTPTSRGSRSTPVMPTRRT